MESIIQSTLAPVGNGDESAPPAAPPEPQLPVELVECEAEGQRTIPNNFQVSTTGVAQYNGFLAGLREGLGLGTGVRGGSLAADARDEDVEMPQEAQPNETPLQALEFAVGDCVRKVNAPPEDDHKIVCYRDNREVRPRDRTCVFVVNAEAGMATSREEASQLLKDAKKRVPQVAEAYTDSLYCVPATCSKKEPKLLWKASYMFRCTRKIASIGEQYGAGNEGPFPAVGDDDTPVWVFGAACQYGTRCWRRPAPETPPPATPPTIGSGGITVTPVVRPRLECFHRKGACGKPSIGDTGETIDVVQVLHDMVYAIIGQELGNNARSWRNVRTDDGAASITIPLFDVGELYPCQPVGMIQCNHEAYGFGAAMETANEFDCALARKVLERAIGQARKNAWAVQCPAWDPDSDGTCTRKAVKNETNYELRFAIELPANFRTGDSGQVFHFGMAQVPFICMPRTDTPPPDGFSETPTPPDTGGGGTPTPPDTGGGGTPTPGDNPFAESDSTAPGGTLDGAMPGNPPAAAVTDGGSGMSPAEPGGRGMPLGPLGEPRP